MGKTKRSLKRTATDAFDFVFNETVMDVGAFVFDFFTVVVSLWYAVTNTLPVIPQWAWLGIFVFMLIAGTFSLENLMFTDDEFEEIEEDGEIWDE